MEPVKAELAILLFENQSAFEDWLERNADLSPGVWLQLAKKGSGIASLSYAEAVESALCFGWIDSQKKKHDEATWIQKFSPRGAKSIWSKVNKEKVEALIESGRMTPSGMRAIENAKQNGNWDNAYEPQSAALLPEDFSAALQASTKAKTFYDTLNTRNQYAILFRLQQAKKEDTHQRRIRQFIEMLEQGEKIYP